MFSELKYFLESHDSSDTGDVEVGEKAKGGFVQGRGELIDGKVPPLPPRGLSSE